MNLSAWKDRLAAGKYDAPLAALYGAADAPRSRYARLCEEYLRTFGDAPDALLISAPGRTELAGNHTDHQLGIVLCAAVTLDAAAAAASAADNAVISPGEGGKGGRSVYSTLILGDNAYGVTELTGGGLQHIVKQLGSSGTADPLNQRASVGWKATKTAERLSEPYMVRIESCSERYSAKALAN